MSISQVNTQKNKLQDKENSYQTLETNHYKREEKRNKIRRPRYKKRKWSKRTKNPRINGSSKKKTR